MVMFTHGLEELDEWITYLNQCDPGIKVTVEQSEEKINFIDIMINIDRSISTLLTDLYSKSTDSHNYLNYGLTHPSHSKKGLPFSHFLHIRKICSREEDFKKHCCSMKYHFLC